jgi:hypothetical protein
MNLFFKIIEIVLPVILAAGVFWLLLEKWSKQNERVWRWLVEKGCSENQPLINNPLISYKLQAYEALLTMLEMISLPHLVTEEMEPGLTAGMLHRRLLNTVRDQYDKVVPKQLYVTDDTWNRIVAVKEETLSMINESANLLDKDRPAIDLGEIIMAKVFENKEDNNRETMRLIKQEYQRLVTQIEI